jgi:hypothetical protein
MLATKIYGKSLQFHHNDARLTSKRIDQPLLSLLDGKHGRLRSIPAYGNDNGIEQRKCTSDNFFVSFGQRVE